MNQSVLIGIRLKEEREKIGLNQTDFSSLASCTQKTQVLYEKGIRKPDSVYLSAIATAGADINYIIIGQRTAPIQPSRHEDAVLMMYRDLDEKDKKDIYESLEKALRMQELEKLLAEKKLA